MATWNPQIAAGNLDAQQAGTTVTVDGNIVNANAATQYIGLSFTDPPADLPGATIDAAYLEGYFVNPSFASPNVTIRGGQGNHAVFTGAANQISSIPTFLTTVTWQANNIGTGWKTSPDIKSVIQEIVNQSGWGAWATGLTLVISGIDASSGFRLRAYEGAAAEAAKLNITYTPAGGGQPPRTMHQFAQRRGWR